MSKRNEKIETNPNATLSPTPPAGGRGVFRWIKILFLIYGIVGIAFYYGQDKLLLHPEVVKKETKYDFGQQPYTELNIPYDKETNLNIIQFKTAEAANEDTFPGKNKIYHDSISRPGSPKGVVLYFHGNKKNITWYARHVPDFTRSGYEVWMLDYPGFGKSTGKLNEQKLYDYSLVLYKLARSRYTPTQIVIYGKSFGTGVAAQLASVRDCRRLILECAYYSMESVYRHYLPVYPIGKMAHYHLPTNERLPSVTAPVTIFHGTKDGLIPFSNAERLKPLLKTGDEFIPIEGGSHNDLGNFPLFHQKLDSLLKL
ncbi:alpha/beta hydrolase [Flavitalea flava]